jgi:hypothetical protein
MNRLKPKKFRKPKPEGLRLPIKLGSQAELAALIATGALNGHAVHLVVLHDDQCSGDPCRCSPEYRVEELTAETYLEGQRNEREWRRGRLS